MSASRMQIKVMIAQSYLCQTDIFYREVIIFQSVGERFCVAQRQPDAARQITVAVRTSEFKGSDLITDGDGYAVQIAA